MYHGLQCVGLLRALQTSCYCHIIQACVYFMSVNVTFAAAARTRKVSRRPCTCPTTGNILILHKTLPGTSSQPFVWLGWSLHFTGSVSMCTETRAKTKDKEKLDSKQISNSDARAYEVTSFLSTDCELSTETCSKHV